MKIDIPSIDYHLWTIVVYSVTIGSYCYDGYVTRIIAIVDAVLWSNVSGSQFEMAANRSSLINDWSVDCVMLRISNWLKLPSRSTQCDTLHETVCIKLWGKGECCLEYMCIPILRASYIDSLGLTNPTLMTCWPFLDYWRICDTVD